MEALVRLIFIRSLTEDGPALCIGKKKKTHSVTVLWIYNQSLYKI